MKRNPFQQYYPLSDKTLILWKTLSNLRVDFQESFERENFPPVPVENDKLLPLYLEITHFCLRSLCKSAKCQE